MKKINLQKLTSMGLASFLLFSPMIALGNTQKTTIDITPSDIHSFLQIARFPKTMTALQQHDFAVSSLINLDLLDRQARKENFLSHPSVNVRLSLARLQILSSAALQYYFDRHPITNAALHKEYVALKESSGHLAVSLSQILVRTHQEASRIIHQLDANPKAFSKVASKESINHVAAEHGGFIGWYPIRSLSPAYRAHIRSAPIGSILPPFHTSFGWVILRIDGRKKINVPPFLTLKPQLQRIVERKNAAKWIARLRSHAKISIS